jgi:hypothetical protein
MSKQVMIMVKESIQSIPDFKIELHKAEGIKLYAFYLKFNDDCNNGHKTFTLTGEQITIDNFQIESCGMMHEEFMRLYPQYSHFVQWHLVSSDGPLHYIENSCYWAGFTKYTGIRMDYLKTTMVFQKEENETKLFEVIQTGKQEFIKHLVNRYKMIMDKFEKALNEMKEIGA